MNSRFFAFSLLSMLAARAADAAVLYDSINVGASGNANYDGISNDNPLMAASFAMSGTSALNVTLALSADSPGDTGSVLVYLAPDDGNGAGAGVAADPITVVNAAGQPTGFNGGQLVQTIADASLVNTLLVAVGTVPSNVVTFTIPSAAVSLVHGLTANQEYWIGLSLANGSSAEWWTNADGSGIGTANQNDFETANGLNGFSPTGGAYELTVSNAPEPTTLAILGGGLAGLGYVRRRGSRKGLIV